MIPDTISHYRILGKLGAGGMGEVYLAEDTQLRRKVAIKFLPPESTADNEAKRRLIHEARAAAKLDHPNICLIYEVGDEGGHTFIVTQYLEGETLASRLQRNPMELKESLYISVQIADALSEAHSCGIIHRDIKPQNIMLTAREQVKVLDFGLAKVAQVEFSPDSGATTQSLLTEPGTIVGTVPYMSPEQVKGQSLDSRSDIFSFGAVLYEMIGGRQPFAAKNAAETLSSILTREPPPLALYSREVPAELERIVSKALEKDREERYQVVKDLLLDLKRLKQRLEFEAERARSTGPHASSESTHSYETANLQTAQQQARRSRPRRSIDSLAVLPLVNASGEPDTEYLSDGITESLISNLSQLPRLRVMARTTVFRFKGREEDALAVGRELNVRAVLTGRVLQRGERVVIRVELVDVAEGTHLWGEQYNRELEDIFAIEAEIAQEISEKLRLKLSRGEKKRLTKRHTENIEAYQLYLKGRYYLYKRSEEAAKRALGYFEQAITVDPSYAPAYAGIADAYMDIGTGFNAVLPATDARPKGKVAALRALEIDDKLAEAHAALGATNLCYDWDWSGADSELRRSIQLNPSYAPPHWWYALLFSAMGRLDDAIGEAKRAQEIEPLAPYSRTLIGRILYYARRYDQAIAQLQRPLELDPGFIPARYWLARAFIMKSEYQEAIAELQTVVSLSGRSPVMLAALGHAYAISDNQVEARQLLNGLNELSKQRYVASYNIAEIHAGLGEKDRAFELLQKAHIERTDLLIWLNVDPVWDGLRLDPRFADLMQRIGLPQ